MNYGCQSMVTKIDTILLKKPEAAFVSQEHLNENWERFCYYGCPDYEKVLEEYAAFEAIIKEHVENVYYLPYDERTGLDSIYTHDSPEGDQQRRHLLPDGQGAPQQGATGDGSLLTEHGVPTLGYITPPGKMEGGDVLWIDEKTVAIGRGYRTNDEGIRQFKELTKDFVDEYIIVPMPHGDGEEAACT